MKPCLSVCLSAHPCSFKDLTVSWGGALCPTHSAAYAKSLDTDVCSLLGVSRPGTPLPEQVHI